METTAKRFRKRDAILACLQETDCHPSADWIYARLKRVIPDISLGTVYRNLNYFKEQGKIVSVGTVRGVERFDGDLHPHVHFLCTGCGRVQDLADVPLPEAPAISGQVTGCSLTYSGLCGDCLQNHEGE